MRFLAARGGPANALTSGGADKQQIPGGNDNKDSRSFVVIPQGNLLLALALTTRTG